MHGEQAHRWRARPSAGRLLVVLAIGLAAVWAVGISTAVPVLLWLGPALVLGAVLLTRRYPGEHLLLRRRASPTRHWAQPEAAQPAKRHTPSFIARGGQLIARALAVRPPPALPCAAS